MGKQEAGEAMRPPRLRPILSRAWLFGLVLLAWNGTADFVAAQGNSFLGGSPSHGSPGAPQKDRRNFLPRAASRAALQGEAPRIIESCSGSSVAAMPDGTMAVFLMGRGEPLHIDARKSIDGGRTWSDVEKVCDLPPGHWSGPQALVTRDGRLHFFLSRWRGEGRRPAVDRFIDLWHMAGPAVTKTAFAMVQPSSPSPLPFAGMGSLKSPSEAAGEASLKATPQVVRERAAPHWTAPQRIFEGYCGALLDAVEMPSGKIVVPFAAWVAGRPSAPPTGSNETTCVYSEDGGRSWKPSASRLTAPCHEGYNGGNYGAIEPVVLPLTNGRAWMLIRTQTGFLYESFSRDGANWSEARASQFFASNSPARLVRLPDGRIVLFWNNCQVPPRENGQGVYGGRDALHAAISEDEGKTWRGYREVYRDPLRNQTPPKTGDRGTAYPQAAATPEGRIVLVSGQGAPRRRLILVDPDWLCQTHAEDDFSRGLGAWHVFKSFGPAFRFWRDRVQGAVLVSHPEKSGGKVLQVRRPDERPGDGAVWNFPAGRKGAVSLRLCLEAGFGGASVAMGDRFFDPTDDHGEKQAMFLFPIGADGRLPGGSQLHTGRWHNVEMAWDLGAGRCRVRVDGREAGMLVHQARTDAGLSYLRLRSTAGGIDRAGLLLEKVSVDIDAQPRKSEKERVSKERVSP